MRHLRKDYEAIQPWPVKRPHNGKLGRENPVLVMNAELGEGSDLDPLINDDEPVFLLRGQDPCSEQVVLVYAAHLQELGGDPDLVSAIQEWAVEMGNYAKRNGRRGHVPDVPEGLLR